MRIVDWLRGWWEGRPGPAAPVEPGAPDEAAPEPLTDEAIADLLARAAAEGYRTDAEVVEQLTEELVDEHGEDAGVPARVARLAPRVFAARLEEERSWTVPTDCDRLDRAFERLEQAGVVARQDFACCQNCGHAEIGDEIEETRALRPVRGYTFFHHQDTERAVDGGPLYLAYGAVPPEGTSKEAWIEAEAGIGREIVAALEAEGLRPAWNGERTKRIQVGLVWRRRRARA